tara:strand:+ start:1395 stop:1946 length:552 start_codon:yes stop_codon:yes gene_type:complete
MTTSSKPVVPLNHSYEKNDGGQLLRIPTRDTLDDKLNQQIISMLEIDGRLPFKEIAKALDVSEGTVRNRVNRLKDAGVLQIKALVDRSAINYATDSMLGIKVAPTSSPSEVAKRLQNCNEIVFIIWVTGRYDLLVEIVSDGDDTLCRFLEEHCFNKDDISNTEVMKGLTTYKNQFLLKSHDKL